MDKRTLYPFVIAMLIRCEGVAQEGYNRLLKTDRAISLTVDGITFYRDTIFLTGNASITSPGLVGAWHAAVDTTGEIIWESFLLDSSSHIIMNTPNNICVNDEYIYASLKYFNLQRLGWLKLDHFGNLIDSSIFPMEDVFIHPNDIIAFGEHNYMFGYVNENNAGNGSYVIKTDLNGNIVWKRRFLPPSGNSGFADVVDHKDGRFSISSAVASDDFLKDNKIQGWIKPWIFTIDTSGEIIESWFGDENDERTFGYGPLLQVDSGDWIIGSTEYVEQWSQGNYWIRRIPTISRLDSEFNLVWKKVFPVWPGYTDKWLDFEYDSVRHKIMAVGERGVRYDSTGGELSMWLVKLTPEGEVIWDIADTIISNTYNEVTHHTAGLAIAPSGSIYVAGYVDQYTDTPFQSGWLVKATPDGCIETICTTTSLQEQITAKAGIQILFPNPVRDEMRIRLPEPTEERSALWIYNTQGMIVHQEPIDLQTHSFSTDLPDGVYFYELREGNAVRYIGKFVKL